MIYNLFFTITYNYNFMLFKKLKNKIDCIVVFILLLILFMYRLYIRKYKLGLFELVILIYSLFKNVP